MEERMPEENTIYTLRLTGDCSVQHATDILKRFSQALETTDNLALDLSEVENTDLSLLQIICAAHQSFAARAKKISLSRPPADAVIAVWRDGGFGRVCMFAQEECLFKEVSLNG